MKMNKLYKNCSMSGMDVFLLEERL